MGVKDRLRCLQKAARGKLDHIELADGSRYWFDRQEVFWVTFRFFTASMRADWKREPRPDPPAVLRAVADARNREQALSRVMGGSSFFPGRGSPRRARRGGAPAACAWIPTGRAGWGP